ncbi:MAG: helix-hairpin-helix domain-containing protein [Acidobacteria bacterium]|nr:helix-hairpin-helix domain-containing protein [Acidobacteriota bacterium]
MKMAGKIPVWAGVFASIVLGASVASAQRGGSAEAGGGPEMIQQACSGCHELTRITQVKKTAAQWEETLADMVRRGAPVLEGERPMLLQFLVNNYGSGSSGTNVAAGQMGGAQQVSASDARGREIAQQACSVCHGLDYPFEARRSPSEWEATVNDMIGRGAPLLEGERPLLLQFLAKYYGPEKPRTNINQASAQELMTAFGLSQSEADEIARYKQQHGSIYGWEDLRKIPNLDLKKLEAKRDVLAFL